MFYLKEFGKLFKTNFVISLCFIFSVASLILSVQNKENINSFVNIKGQQEIVPYFNALINNNINLDSIKRKMSNLPGVFRVVTSEQSLNRELNHLKKNFGEDIIAELSALQYKKVKIELDEGIHKKNQVLVREYLTRLVGKDGVTMGAIKTPPVATLVQDKNTWLLAIDDYLIAILTIFTSFFLFLILNPLGNQVYIIEKFQRRKQVGLKVLLAGTGLIGLLTLGINYSYQKEIPVMGSVTMLLIMLSFVGLYQLRKPSYRV